MRVSRVQLVQRRECARRAPRERSPPARASAISAAVPCACGRGTTGCARDRREASLRDGPLDGATLNGLQMHWLHRLHRASARRGALSLAETCLTLALVRVKALVVEKQAYWSALMVL